MAEFTWDVLLPGEDLPHRLTTDYVVSDGEEITVDGRLWLVEKVDIDESVDPATGIVSVIPSKEP